MCKFNIQRYWCKGIDLQHVPVVTTVKSKSLNYTGQRMGCTPNLFCTRHRCSKWPRVLTDFWTKLYFLHICSAPHPRIKIGPRTALFLGYVFFQETNRDLGNTTSGRPHRQQGARRSNRPRDCSESAHEGVKGVRSKEKGRQCLGSPLKLYVINHWQRCHLRISQLAQVTSLTPVLYKSDCLNTYIFQNTVIIFRHLINALSINHNWTKSLPRECVCSVSTTHTQTNRQTNKQASKRGQRLHKQKDK